MSEVEDKIEEQIPQEEGGTVEHYRKIIEYKSNVLKTDALLAIEKDPGIQEELNKIRANLIQAISYEEDVIKFTENSDEYYFSTDILENNNIDRICQVYLKSGNKWLHAKIESVDMENQDAEVTIIGLNQRVKAHACFIKLLPIPDQIYFQAGTQCEAIYSGDGRYYQCTIEKIVEGGYVVKFKKYNNKETVSLFHLRELEEDVDIDADFGDMKEFKIPDHLKVLPNDSEVQRKKKKKKIKALKNAWKNQQIEKHTIEKQSKWSDFTNKAAQHKKGHFHHNKGESIFKTPEGFDGKVGVTGSGKGMTNFIQKSRYIFDKPE